MAGAAETTQTSADESEWLDEVNSLVERIERLPAVKGRVGFGYGNTANLNKVYVSIWCCWEPSRRTFKQLKVCCDLKERPTHLQALQELHAIIISKHMCENHVWHAAAAARRQKLLEAAASEEDDAWRPPDHAALLNARNAFERMRAGQELLRRFKVADEAVRVAKKREFDACMSVKAAKTARLEAVQQREHAMQERAELEALRNKLGKTSERAGQQTQTECGGQQASSDSEDVDEEEAEATSNESIFLSWNDASQWKAKEAYIQGRRRVPIDPKLNADVSPPRDGTKHGWRTHWRRGLYGAVQDWAAGRRMRVVHMLVHLAAHFHVETEVPSPCSPLTHTHQLPNARETTTPQHHMCTCAGRREVVRIK